MHILRIICIVLNSPRRIQTNYFSLSFFCIYFPCYSENDKLLRNSNINNITLLYAVLYFGVVVN